MNWEQKYDALASMIEGYRHERNEALERVRLLEAEVERVNAREDATRRELYATCIDMRDAERERDEWRDKFHALNQTAGELCNACGWSFKLPGEPCRCEIVKERDCWKAKAEGAKP